MQILEEIMGRCVDVTPLAEGGQKKVWSALHPDYGPVVIKCGEYRYANTLERITREVQLLKSLDSPYYPKHFKFLIDPVNQEFLVIEEKLQAVELNNARQKLQDSGAVRSLLKSLVCALNVIWQRNVIHRDIKPANILITDKNEPRIIDLGIARFLDDTSLTASIAEMGPATPVYAAPEQLLNKKAMINVRTDFFLLGLLILELIHGFHPFDPRFVKNGQSLVDNLLSGVYVPAPQSHDHKVLTFIDRVLVPQPYRRFRTVEELMTHLEMDGQSC